MLPPNSVILEWIPSHTGIDGNEKADNLAKKALELPTINPIPLSLTEFNHLIREHYRQLWQQEWSSSPRTSQLQKPTLGPPKYSNLACRDSVLIARLRLGVTKLSHGHYFRQTPHPVCNFCSTPHTLTHVVLAAPSTPPREPYSQPPAIANKSP